MASAQITIHTEQVPRLMAEGRLQLREDILYTDARGRENRSIAKRARKALELLRGPLERLLEPDEAILYVARANLRLSTLQQFTLGWAAYSIARTEMVFTTKRLLFFRVQGNGKWTRSLRGVRWEDVAQAKTKGWVSHIIDFTYTDGSKESYWQLKRADKKKAGVLLAALTQRQSVSAGAPKAAMPLCPDCFAALTPGIYRCSACGLVFKDEAAMMRLALLIPGGGYFYSRQPVLGLLDALVESVFTFWVIFFGLAFAGVFVPTDEFNQPLPTADVGGTLLVLVLVLAFEKAVTIYHCRHFLRDFLPTKKKLDSARAMGAATIG